MAEGGMPGGNIGFTGSSFSLMNNPSALIRYPSASSDTVFSTRNTASGLSTVAVLLTGLLGSYQNRVFTWENSSLSNAFSILKTMVWRCMLWFRYNWLGPLIEKLW